MAAIKERFIRLVLLSSAGGKTTAARTLGSQGFPVLDTDDARTPSADVVLRALRREQWWSLHNVQWDPLVAGAVMGRWRQFKWLGYTGPISVLDHTGWFIENQRLWPWVNEVVLVEPPPIAKRVELFLARRVSFAANEGKLDTPESIEKMLMGQDLARASLVNRTPKGLPRRTIHYNALWRNPSSALLETSMFWKREKVELQRFWDQTGYDVLAGIASREQVDGRKEVK